MKKCFSIAFMVLFCTAWAGLAQASSLDDGLTAYYQKNWTLAGEKFRKATKEDPNDSLPLVYEIVASYWNGTAEHALQTTEDDLTDNPNNQLAQIQLGFMYYTKALIHGKKADQALSEFREAAKLGQSNLLHAGLGIVYFDMGNFTRAKKELARAMDMNPKDGLPLEYIGRIALTFDNNPQLAATYFKQETDLEPSGYPDSHYYYAVALDAMDKTDEALVEYTKALALDPLGVGRGVDAQIAIGDLYLRTKQFADARKAYQNALGLNPNDPSIKLHLAELDKAEKAGKTK